MTTKKTFTVVHSAHPCTELLLDVNKIRAYLASAGYEETDEQARAALVIVSTCAFNQEYEDDAMHAITAIKEQIAPDARVIVTGCLSKINPDRFAELGSSVEAIPPREMSRLEELFPSSNSIDDIEAHTVSIREYEGNRLFMLGIRLKKLFRALPLIGVPTWLDTVPMTDWYFVRAATGCMGMCSYCAIKRSRGNLLSTPPEKVVEQVREAVRLGYREISLAGDDLGCYGADIGTNLPALLRDILAVDNDFVLNIRFVEPKWLLSYVDEMIPILDSGRLTSFCVPLQSGSQRILDGMKRDYPIGEVVETVNRILRTTRLSSLSSIAMVGFPGETTEDFAATYALLESCDINMYQVLEYQGRPGTASEELPNKVPEKTKAERRARFQTKMKAHKFARIPASIAERWAAFKHGPLV